MTDSLEGRGWWRTVNLLVGKMPVCPAIFRRGLKFEDEREVLRLKYVPWRSRGASYHRERATRGRASGVPNGCGDEDVPLLLPDTRAKLTSVFDLAADPRTSHAYAGAWARNVADPRVGVPTPTGPSVDLLLHTLAPSETSHWLSWAYELRDGPTVWWLVALTTNRLVGVSPAQTPLMWAMDVRSWSTSFMGGDIVLHLPGGAPLRVRGSADALHLFDPRRHTVPRAVAPQGDEPVSRGPNAQSRALAPPPSLVEPIMPSVAEPGVDLAGEADVITAASGQHAIRLTRRQARRAAGPRPRRPRRRRVRRQRVGFAPPSTIWDLADNCVKCGRALTDPRSRQARVGTKCIRIYGSQQRRVSNPQHAAWIDRRTKADVAYVAEKVLADAEFAHAKAAYDAARAEWARVRAAR